MIDDAADALHRPFDSRLNRLCICRPRDPRSRIHPLSAQEWTVGGEGQQPCQPGIRNMPDRGLTNRRDDLEPRQTWCVSDAFA